MDSKTSEAYIWVENTDSSNSSIEAPETIVALKKTFERLNSALSRLKAASSKIQKIKIEMETQEPSSGDTDVRK